MFKNLKRKIKAREGKTVRAIRHNWLRRKLFRLRRNRLKGLLAKDDELWRALPEGLMALFEFLKAKPNAAKISEFETLINGKI